MRPVYELPKDFSVCDDNRSVYELPKDFSVCDDNRSAYELPKDFSVCDDTDEVGELSDDDLQAPVRAGPTCCDMSYMPTCITPTRLTLIDRVIAFSQLN